jgi:hypothetical protein
MTSMNITELQIDNPSALQTKETAVQVLLASGCSRTEKASEILTRICGGVIF